MLYLVLLYLFTTALCLWAGLIFYSLFHYINRTDFDTSFQRPLICYLLSGLILITCLGQWIVLAFPLDFSALIYGVIPVLTILSLFLRRSITISFKNLLAGQLRHPLFLPCFGIFLLLILTLNAGPTIMDDTGSYHIQMVKWAQEYGTVPGIANLHLRFGFNSSWFLSIALLLPKIKNINSYMALNGLISSWLSFYLLQKIFDVFSSRETSAPGAAPNVNIFYAALILFILGIVIWPMLRGNATSANYDFISTCCIVVLFMETSSPAKPAFPPEWIVWPFYLGTIKQINLVLSLLYVLSMLRSFKNFKKRTLLIYIVAGSFILIPFCIRNLLLTGYLLYPFYQLDLFSFDWKVSKPLVIELLNYIKYFNRSNGESYQVAGLPLTGWIPVWHHNLVLYDQLLTDFSLLCWLLILVRWRKLMAFSAQFRLFILTMFIALLTWFLVAPDPRFIYGILLASLFTFLLTLPSLSSTAQCQRIVMITLLAISGSALVYTVRKVMTHSEYRNWMLPCALPVPQTQTLTVDGIELHIPDKVLDNWNPRCYDLALPCLYMLNPYLRARGKKIGDGFRVDKDAVEGENKILKNL